MFILSNTSYDFVKKLVQVILPACGALYFGLASIWNLPAAEQVVGTIALFTTFLGVALGISHTTYMNSDAPYDGRIIATPTQHKTLLALDFDENQEEGIENKDTITFKVVHQPYQEIPVHPDLE